MIIMCKIYFTIAFTYVRWNKLINFTTFPKIVSAIIVNGDECIELEYIGKKRLNLYVLFEHLSWKAMHGKYSMVIDDKCVLNTIWIANEKMWKKFRNDANVCAKAEHKCNDAGGKVMKRVLE